MTKLIYLGCLSRDKYKETCENAIKIITNLDAEYETLEDPPCCGAITHHVGSDEELKSHLNFVNDWLKANEVSEIITICAGCYNYLSSEYKKFIPDFSVKVRHILQFIAIPENLEKLNLKYPGKKLAVNYHDPCHLKNASPKIIEEPRIILNSIEGIELKEMENTKEFSLCCGSGGGVYSSFKENAEYNSLAIFKQMRRTKALLTPCPFCYTALKAIKEDKANKIRNPVFKFEDFIFKLMNGEDPLK